jgi:hypothetical protein
MLLIASLPVSLLAGATTQALLRGEIGSTRCRRAFVRVVAAAAILVGGFAVRQFLQGQTIAFHGYWVTLAITIPVAYWVLGTPYSVPGGRRLLHRLPAFLWIAVLVVDLWAITWPLVAVRPESDIYTPSACVEYLASKSERTIRVLDVDSDDEASPLGRGAPLAMRHHLEAVRGYNPLDVRRYKEYLQRIADDDTPLRPFGHPLAWPIIGDVPINNRALLDLLGVRYLLQPQELPPPEPAWRKVYDDPSPAAFDVVAGGRLALVPYSVYENEQALPRVFVVPSAVVGNDITAVELRRTVVLEESPAEGTAATESGYWSASITEYQPNRVDIAATGTTPGWLVLTDIWYPGWKCMVDGEETKVYRGDFLYRTVHLEAGRHEIIFNFEPDSYRRGKSITVIALALIAGLLFVYPAVFHNQKFRSKSSQ